MQPIERLLTEEQIQARVQELGHQIARDYSDVLPVLIGVLKGSAFFLADLVRAIDTPVTVDVIAISSFGGSGASSAGGSDNRDKGGRAKIMKDLDVDIGGRDVILVEDLIDTGLTGAYLMRTLRTRECKSIEICTLLDKTVRRIAPIELRYTGFECPDRFVIGYGLDYAERFRSLTSIYAVDDPEGTDEATLLRADRLGLSIGTDADTVDAS